jgi:hypothetical protein
MTQDSMQPTQIDNSEVNPVYPGPDAPPFFVVDLDDADLSLIAGLIAKRNATLGGVDVPAPVSGQNWLSEVHEWYGSRWAIFSNAQAGEIGLTIYDLRKLGDDLVGKEIAGYLEATTKALDEGDVEKASRMIKEQMPYIKLSGKIWHARRIDTENAR